MVRHLPFIEALAHAAPEEWDTLKVGYLVLRVFDDWVRSGPAVMMNDSRFETIFADIEKIPTVNAAHGRACRAILEGFLNAPGREVTIVVGPLMGYGALLGIEKRWILAADVYETVSNAFTEVQPLRTAEREMLANALFQQASALRKAGMFNQAIQVYRNAAQTGKHLPVPAIRLHAFVGLANIARTSGDLPKAERILTAVLRTAEYLGPKVTAAYADALHARGSVRQVRENHIDAIRDLFMAYQLTEDLGTRESILTDLGVCAGDAGYRSAARDALSLIADHGYSVLSRAVAIVNLIELAVLDGDKAEFEQRRSEWENFRSSIDTNTHAYANLYVARGIARFVKGTIAKQAYQDAIQYAKEHRIPEVEVLASHEFDELTRAGASQKASKSGNGSADTRLIPDDLTDIVRALSEMRDRAMVAV